MADKGQHWMMTKRRMRCVSGRHEAGVEQSTGAAGVNSSNRQIDPRLWMLGLEIVALHMFCLNNVACWVGWRPLSASNSQGAREQAEEIGSSRRLILCPQAPSDSPQQFRYPLCILRDDPKGIQQAGRKVEFCPGRRRRPADEEIEQGGEITPTSCLWF